jgi:hypothetical protein
MDEAMCGEVLVGDGNRCRKLSCMFHDSRGLLTVLAHEGNQSAVSAPNNIFHWRAINFGNRLLLLNVIEDY